MKRLTIILGVLSIIFLMTTVITTKSLINMSSYASYWMERSEAGERIIERIEIEQTDYVLDILSEGDEYQTWLEYTEI